MPSPCTVTAQFNDAAGASLQGNAFVRFRLRNFSGFVPRVLGTAIVVETQIDVAPSAGGAVSTALWGNDNIDPGGANNPPSTFYTVEYWNQGRITSQANYSITGASFNLGTAAPISTPAAPVSGFTPITLQTNEVQNGSQSLLDLHAGTNVTLTDNGAGRVTIASVNASGSLAIGAVAAAPSTLNVSTEGAKDWFAPSPGNAGQAIYLPHGWRWKASGIAGSSAKLVESFRLISVGSAVTYSSGNGSGTPSITATAGDEACDVNDNFTPPFGYPTTSQAAYRSLISVNYPGNPFGWSFLAPSDGNTRTLNLYFDIGGNTSANNSITATIFAHLLDGSAADVSSAVTLGGGTGSSSYKVSITFKSSTGSHLLVTGLITAASGTNPGCELRFRAATVQ